MTDAPDKTPDPDRAAALADPRPRNRSHWLLWLLLLVVIVLAWWWYSQRGVDVEQVPTTTPELTAPVDADTPADAPADIDRPARPDREPRPTGAQPSPSAPPAMTPAIPLTAQNPKPAYPAEALRVGQGGTVLLRVEVGVGGRVDKIEFASRSSSRELDQAARDAVANWRFTPAMRNGEPVASTVEVPVEFNPEG